jgi:hypothetical protein
MSKAYRVILLHLAALAVAACAGARAPTAAGSAEGVPAWVTEGSTAKADHSDGSYMGVGMASDIRNQALATSSAENRARAEVAKALETHVASVMKDYLASTAAGAALTASEEQHVEQASKSFSSQAMTGVLIVDRFVAADGTVYALARLDVKANELAQAAQGAPMPQTCTALLKVVQLGRSSSTCWIDERVSKTQGRLTYPCAGGAAEATFGEAVFTGELRDGRADLALTTTFDFQDGCRWTSDQHITGRLATDHMDYAYSEAPLAGQSGCASACTAKGAVYLRQP